MPDEAPPVAAGVAGVAPPPSVADADQLRRFIVYAAFVQFNFFILMILVALIWKGWEMPPTANSLIMIIITGESNVIMAAVAFYLGSSVKGESSSALPPTNGQ